MKAPPVFIFDAFVSNTDVNDSNLEAISVIGQQRKLRPIQGRWRSPSMRRQSTFGRGSCRSAIGVAGCTATTGSIECSATLIVQAPRRRESRGSHVSGVGTANAP